LATILEEIIDDSTSREAEIVRKNIAKEFMSVLYGLVRVLYVTMRLPVLGAPYGLDPNLVMF
jgi:hypothetical protein